MSTRRAFVLVDADRSRSLDHVGGVRHDRLHGGDAVQVEDVRVRATCAPVVASTVTWQPDHVLAMTNLPLSRAADYASLQSKSGDALQIRMPSSA